MQPEFPKRFNAVSAKEEEVEEEKGKVRDYTCFPEPFPDPAQVLMRFLNLLRRSGKRNRRFVHQKRRRRSR